MTQKEINEMYSRPFLTARDIGELLGIKRQAVHQLIDRGTLKAYPIEVGETIGSHRTEY